MQDNMSRNEVIKQIKKNLQARSGKKWSVTGGRGTAYCWISIEAPPSEGGGLKGDRAELAKNLLGLDSVHHQGISIPGSNDYYQEYLDRSAGIAPTKIGRPYWD